MSRCLVAVFFGILLSIASQAGPLVQFRIATIENGVIALKEVDVELFDKDKPITVQNFIRYIQSGRYKDSIMHRCVPGFVIQGGGLYIYDRGGPQQGLDYIETFGTIPNEYGRGTIYSNRYGTIAMAKLPGNTNSASSQWYINLADNFDLDAHDNDHYFTVFGRVVDGTNVLNLFSSFRPWSGSTNETNVVADLSGFPYFLGEDFRSCPLLRGIVEYPYLVYTDVSLLNIQVKKVNNAREISWNSVTGKVNRVEFTTNLPPVWYSLIQTNPTTSTVTVQDTSSGASRRFYRVRVEY